MHQEQELSTSRSIKRIQTDVHRWAGLLSVAAQRALAETLLELPAAAAPGVDGEPPPFAATLADVRWHERPPDSCLLWLYIASPNGKVHWRVRRRVGHAAGKKKNVSFTGFAITTVSKHVETMKTHNPSYIQKHTHTQIVHLTLKHLDI